MGRLTPLALVEPPVRARAEGPRYAVIHLPAWQLERCGWSAHEVVGLVAERRSAVRLVAVTPGAAAAGLRVGMTASEARALVAGVVLEPLDPEGEASDREALVQAFHHLTDRHAPWGEHGVVVELSTVAQLWGGEQAAAERLARRARELGHEARVVVADHPRAAAALAVWGEGGDVPVEVPEPEPVQIDLFQAPEATEAPLQVRVVPPGEGAEALAALPLGVLDPPPELHEALRTLGLRRVGDFAGLDPASVVGRFGPEALALHRVARGAPGPSWAQLPQESPPERLRLALDHELVGVDQVVRALTPGLQRLQAQLQARDHLAAAVELRLELAWGAPVRVQLRPALPTRDPTLLGKLLGERLERVRLEAPVTGLCLHAHHTASDSEGQQDLLDRRGTSTAWTELLSRLGDVLGSRALCQPVLEETWVPEEAWRAEAPGAAPPPEVPSAHDADDVVGLQEAPSWHLPQARPALLHRTPQPVAVRTNPQGAPIAVRRRGGWDPVQRRRGPERLHTPWWTPSGGHERRYWVVALPRGEAWLFQAREQWFVHGWFD